MDRSTPGSVRLRISLSISNELQYHGVLGAPFMPVHSATDEAQSSRLDAMNSSSGLDVSIALPDPVGRLLAGRRLWLLCAVLVAITFATGATVIAHLRQNAFANA